MKAGIINAACILLAVICLADETEKKKDVESFRSAVEWFGKGPHAITPDEAFSTIKKRAETCNLTQAEAVAEMTAIAREYRKLSEDFSEGVTDRSRVNEEMRTIRVLGLIVGFKDSLTLPLFEEMAGASNGSTRVYAVRAYIRVADVDSVPFIQKAFQKYPGLLMEYTVIEEFGRQLKKIKSLSPDKDINGAYIFLLKEVQEGKCRGDILDKVLCENLPEYSTSVQREMAAETMMKSENEFLRGMGNNIKTEIEKTPKEKHKDFTAKGELLDPERMM